MTKSFVKKNILVTAGPVWVKIDRVRVITSIFSGRLGIQIAETSAEQGHSVTLLVGPGHVELPQKKNIKLIKFHYYDELKNLITKILKRGRYHSIVHSAAVADYAPVSTRKSKIPSNKPLLVLKLRPTEKIIDVIKRIQPTTQLVKFKLEVNVPKKKLIDIAYRSMKKSRADYIVANDLNDLLPQHKAYIIDSNKRVVTVVGKKQIAKKITGFF